MRILLDILAVLMVVGAIATISWHFSTGDEDQSRALATRAAVERLTQEARFRAATGRTEVNGRGWAVMIDPEWFASDTPRNLVVPPDRPWLEIASTDEARLDHPPIRVALDNSLASFWYNPANGLIRARVGQHTSDRRALELYNLINASSVTALFDPTSPEDYAAADDDTFEPIPEPKPRIMINVRRHPAPAPEQTATDDDETPDDDAPVAETDAESTVADASDEP